MAARGALAVLRLGLSILCLLAVMLPVRGQETLQQIEARAAALKGRGDAAGARAPFGKAAGRDPKTPRPHGEIGIPLAGPRPPPGGIPRIEPALPVGLDFCPYHHL